MNGWISSFTDLDDRINPIVIKELRQAVNGRFLAAVLILFLLISLITMCVILMAAGSSNLQAGRDALMALQVILIITCMTFPSIRPEVPPTADEAKIPVATAPQIPPIP